MKKAITQISESELLNTYPIKGKTKDWYFRLNEVANNCWEICGSDRWGRKVYRTGVDPDLLIEEAESDAKCISNNISNT